MVHKKRWMEMMKGANRLNLSRYEQETIIIYNEAGDIATVETCNDALIKRLDRLCDVHDAFIRIRSDENYVKYEIPKKYIGIKTPRIISKERRAKMSSIARENFGKKQG